MKGIRVVEVGDRIAVGACGSLLTVMGAEVILIEPKTDIRNHKWLNRALVAAGKRSLRADTSDDIARALMASADVVIASSDLAALPPYQRPPAQIVCDITAYGTSGPLAGHPHPDALVQAVTGLIDTTGEAHAAPTIIQFPIVEGIAALFAVAGIQSALRVRAQAGIGQNVEVALYDCAFSTLTTFLPLHFAGAPVSRYGNGHVLAVPWNAYRAHDGWLIICTTTDDQWARLCGVMESPELALEPRFRELRGRVKHRVLVDAAIQAWVGHGTVAECVKKLQSRDIACGPIIAAEDLLHEPNIKHRGAFVLERDPESGHDIAVLGAVIRVTGHRLAELTKIPIPDEDHWLLARSNHPSFEAPSSRTEVRLARPLAGIRVLEIGQFTTGPLATRHLAALGAEVIKIEPPTGDGARAYVPQENGESYFFILSNSDKRSLSLDLRKERDRDIFKALVVESDVLIENLKPGSLDRLGVGAKALSEINPRLIYCAVSGFGADSIYPGRAAFDTVIQAMSGVMDLNRVNGIPQKTGVSMADVVGGLFGLVGTLHALALRDTEGCAEQIDVSMQDTAAWITQWRPRDAGTTTSETKIFECNDGYAVAALPMAGSGRPSPNDLISSSRQYSRTDFAKRLADRGIMAAPVLSVAEAADSQQTSARSLLLHRTDRLGCSRIVLNCPIGLSATPARVENSIGPLGEANEQVKIRLRQLHASS